MNEEKNKKIKAVIFDYGGVFTKEGRMHVLYEHCAKKYRKEIDENFLQQAKEIWSTEQVSEASESLFWNFLGNYFATTSEEIMQESARFYGFQQEMLEFAKSLKGKYKVGMITNNISHWFEENMKSRGLDEVFDDIVTSYGVGIAKPDRAIYELSIKNLDVLPGQCVFVDDMERNIIGAQNAGMQTILFQDLGQLKNDLRELGVE